MLPAKPWWSPCSPKPQHRQDTRHRRCRALSLCFAGVRPGVSGWFNCSRCSTEGLASGKAKDIAPLGVRTFGTGKAVGDIKYCRKIQHLAGHAGYTAGFACSWLTESCTTALEGVPFDSVLSALQPACVCLYQAACPALIQQRADDPPPQELLACEYMDPKISSTRRRQSAWYRIAVRFVSGDPLQPTNVCHPTHRRVGV
jgi:hypothetical protein